MTAKYKLALIPEGYRVVPEEPTATQLENCGPVEGYEYGRKTADMDHSVWYTAMVKEAPQLDTQPVLRWEGNDLKLFSATVACVIMSGRFIGLYVLGRLKTTYPTEQEARRAAEKALGFPDGLVIEEW